MVDSQLASPDQEELEGSAIDGQTSRSGVATIREGRRRPHTTFDGDSGEGGRSRNIELNEDVMFRVFVATEE